MRQSRLQALLNSGGGPAMKPQTTKYLDAVKRRLRTERTILRALHGIGSHTLAEFDRNIGWRVANTKAIQNLSGRV